MGLERCIEEKILPLVDEKYKVFMARLIPNIPRERIIGVRVPQLRKIAKEVSKLEGVSQFLKSLPHKYIEEDYIHAFIIAAVPRSDVAFSLIDKFLPYVDNWATCDSLRPAIDDGNETRAMLLSYIDGWLSSPRAFTRRFAIEMLMLHFLNDGVFKPEFLDTVAAIAPKDAPQPSERKCRIGKAEGTSRKYSGMPPEEYYLKMMVAWYFAEALVKQYGEAVAYFEERRLDIWTHNAAIKKARESFRISPEKKEHLSSLAVKK